MGLEIACFRQKLRACVDAQIRVCRNSSRKYRGVVQGKGTHGNGGRQ